MSSNSDEQRIGQNLGLDISSDLDAFERDGGGLPYMSFNSDEKRIGQNLGLDISSDLDAFQLDGGGFPYISTSSLIVVSWGLTAAACHMCPPIRMSKE